MRSVAFVLAMAAAVLTSPLSAQVRTTSFGVSGGLTMPLSGVAENAETGYNVTGSLYLRPARYANLGFRADVSLDRFGFEGSDDASLRSFGVALSGQYYVPTSSSVTPYLLAGVGLYSLKTTVVLGSTSVSASDSNLGYNLGAGLSFQLSGFSTFLEAKWVNVMSEPKGSSFAPITFGIRL